MVKTTIEVYAPGQQVYLSGAVLAVVQQVCIMANDSIQYLVAWLDGKTRHSEWVDEFEVVGSETPRQYHIGFKANE